MKEEILDALFEAVVSGDIRKARKVAEKALSEELSADAALEKMTEAMKAADRKYEKKEYFIVDVASSASAMREAFKVLQPYLQVKSADASGKIVIGSLEGNIQSMGKDIVTATLRAAGFEVVDLGVNVSPDTFVDAAIREEAQIIINQLHGKRSLPATTSCGRVLDAAASILDVCHSRTYQGEPAMKLESAALRGRDVLLTEPEIKGSVLCTTHILRKVFEGRNRSSAADLAFSLQSYLATGLADVAIQEAEKTGIDGIGFSGGVAFNRHFALRIRECVEASGIPFHVHEAVPAGDGGVSLGQALAAVSTR